MPLAALDLHGKVALVTGAGRGIGKAIALTMAEAGAEVVAVARTQSEVDQTAREIRHLERKALPIAADIASSAHVEAAAKQALGEFGRVDILVNNAAAHFRKPFVPLPEYHPSEREQFPSFALPTSDAEIWMPLAVNVLGAFQVIRAFVPGMLSRRYGRIINISSVTVKRSHRFNSVYDASKGALVALTRSLAHEWASYNVTVNSIAPGQFYTSASAAMHENPETRSQLLRRIPMGRTGDPREVGPLAVYLASDAASFVTGQLIVIDGGESL